MREIWRRCEGLLREAGEGLLYNRRLQFLAASLLLCAATWFYLSVEARAEVRSPWEVREIPLSVKAGDQLHPSVIENKIVFLDFAEDPAGRMLVDDLSTPEDAQLYGPGISAGPDTDAGFVAWQTKELQACLGLITGDGSRCLAVPAAKQIALSNDMAVTNHDNTTIRLVNFNTMRSRILDSSTSSGLRYDPDISGNRAVWIKERGYAGQYYEPLIVSYDLSSDTSTYFTNTGGGSNGHGESQYERRHPVLSAGRIFYQQRLRQAGKQWDIFEAVEGTFGKPLVEANGDQVNPAASGNFIVYQDNRNGGFNDKDEWVGDWNIYLKDLETGSEIPVAVLPGDQVNPVIKGNVIAWEDNRNGDWDIYAAELLPPVKEPQLGIAIDSAYWKSYADYTTRDLSVRYRINNSGEGPASQIVIKHIAISPPEITVSGSLPDPVDELIAGEQTQMEAKFHLPPGVKQFKTSVFISCRDTAARELWFPAPLS